MSFTKKRPTFRRLLLSVTTGVVISAALLFGLHYIYMMALEKSALKESYIILAGISAILIAISLFFPINKPNRFMKGLGRLFFSVVVLVFLWVGGSFYLVQNEFMFQPYPVNQQQEAALASSPSIEVVKLSHEDGTISHGYLWKTRPEKTGLILYFGGNADMAAERMSSLMQTAQENPFGDYHFLMMDYPGYGQSTGNPSEESIYQMATMAWDFAVNHDAIDAERIVIAGWSLGTGTAVRLAAEKKPSGLLLLAPFYNGSELVNVFIPKMIDGAPDNILQGPLTSLTRNPYKSSEYAKQIQAPTLVIGSRDDRMISYTQAERLEALITDAEFLLLEGGHSSMWHDQKSLSAIAHFLKQIYK